MVQVYHGSHAQSTELSLDNVGSGSGVAHEGFGIYFSSSEYLAATYAHPQDGCLLSAELSELRFVDVNDSFDVLDFDVVDVVSKATGKEVDKVEDILDQVREGAPMGMSGSHLEALLRGALIFYDTDLDFDDFSLLEEGVADAFEALRVMQLSPDSTVLDFYKALAANMKTDPHDGADGVWKASRYFASRLNVPGFSYQDGRTESYSEYGDEVTNYVVFDMSCIKNVEIVLLPGQTYSKPKP